MISAVITTFNRRELLAEALASIRRQTLAPGEIIVIDDGSTDGTRESLPLEDVRYHWQENAGTSAARNIGWRMARGEWIAFLDSDDLWEPQKLEQQMALLRDRPEVEAVFGHAVNFADGGHVAKFDAKMHRLGAPLPAWLPGAALVRRAVLEEMGGFDTHYRTAEVVDWILRLRRRETSLVMLPQVVLRRRLHGGNKQLESDLGRRENFALLRQWQEDRRRAAGEVTRSDQSTTIVE